MQHSLIPFHSLFNHPDTAQVHFVCAQEPYIIPQTMTPPSYFHWQKIYTALAGDKEYDEEERPRRICAAIYANTMLVNTANIAIIETGSLDMNAICFHMEAEGNPVTAVLVNVYNPPTLHSTIEKFGSLMRELGETDQVIALGDFNVHHALWNPPNYNTRQNEHVDALLDIIYRFDLRLVSPSGRPTYLGSNGTGTTIDLVLAQGPIASLVQKCQVLDPETVSYDHGSDHYPILTELIALPRAQRAKWQPDWKNAKWEAVNDNLQGQVGNLPSRIANAEALDNYLHQLLLLLCRTVDRQVPQRSQIPYAKAWLDQERVRPLMTEVNRAKRRLAAEKKANSPMTRIESASRNWKAARAHMRARIQMLKRRHWHVFLDKIDNTTVWKALQYTKGMRESTVLPPLDGPDGEIADTPQLQAELLFNTFFPQQALEVNPPATAVSQSNEVVNLLGITEREIHAALLRMLPNKAPGPDGIPTVLYQKTWPVLGRILTKLYQASYNLSHYSEPL